jgi:hypothetical protein
MRVTVTCTQPRPLWSSRREASDEWPLVTSRAVQIPGIKFGWQPDPLRGVGDLLGDRVADVSEFVDALTRVADGVWGKETRSVL